MQAIDEDADGIVAFRRSTNQVTPRRRGEAKFTAAEHSEISEILDKTRSLLDTRVHLLSQYTWMRSLSEKAARENNPTLLQNAMGVIMNTLLLLNTIEDELNILSELERPRRLIFEHTTTDPETAAISEYN